MEQYKNIVRTKQCLTSIVYFVMLETSISQKEFHKRAMALLQMTVPKQSLAV